MLHIKILRGQHGRGLQLGVGIVRAQHAAYAGRLRPRLLPLRHGSQRGGLPAVERGAAIVGRWDDGPGHHAPARAVCACAGQPQQRPPGGAALKGPRLGGFTATHLIQILQPLRRKRGNGRALHARRMGALLGGQQRIHSTPAQDGQQRHQGQSQQHFQQRKAL